MAIVVFIIGVLFLKFTHTSILADSLNIGKFVYTNVTLTDASFWFQAGMQYLFGVIMVLLGLVYSLTGYQYFPRLDMTDQRSHLVFTFFILLIIVIFGLLLMFVLPYFYL